MLDALQRIMQIQFREAQREDVTVVLNEASSSRARLEPARLPGVNHTPRFWNIVRANTPTMEKAKAWLKEHGQVLEEEV